VPIDVKDVPLWVSKKRGPFHVLAHREISGDGTAVGVAVVACGFFSWDFKREQKHLPKNPCPACLEAIAAPSARLTK
jgi:hypothetical protein